MGVVEGTGVVAHDAKVPDGFAGLEHCAVVLGDELGAAESPLGVGWVSAWDEDGGVVDLGGYGLFDGLALVGPEGSGRGAAGEGNVLGRVSGTGV